MYQSSPSRRPYQSPLLPVPAKSPERTPQSRNKAQPITRIMQNFVMFSRSLLSLAALAVVGISGAQNLIIPDSGNDRFWIFNSFDGSVINNNLFTDATLGTAVNAIESGRGTLFVSDQINDAVYEYSYSGTRLATIASLDNIRGINIHNNQLYVTSNNLGVWRYNLDGTGATQFINNTLSSWDIHFRANDILVTDSTGNDIRRYDFNGAYLGDFYNSPGSPDINFPQQITADGTDIMVAGFSLTNTGIYRFDANGNKIGYLPVNTGVRSTYRLGNGNILWTGGTRVGIYDVNTNTSTDVINQLGTSFRYIEVTAVPEPATLSALGLGALALLRRRKQK